MFEKFSDGSRRALTTAKEAARLRNAQEISVGHMLLGLTMCDAEAANVLATRGVTTSTVESHLPAIVTQPRAAEGDPIPFSEASKAALVDAVRHATTSDGLEAIRTADLLAAVTACDDPEFASLRAVLRP